MIVLKGEGRAIKSIVLIIGESGLTVQDGAEEHRACNVRGGIEWIMRRNNEKDIEIGMEGRRVTHHIARWWTRDREKWCRMNLVAYARRPLMLIWEMC